MGRKKSTSLRLALVLGVTIIGLSLLSPSAGPLGTGMAWATDPPPPPSEEFMGWLVEVGLADFVAEIEEWDLEYGYEVAGLALPELVILGEPVVPDLIEGLSHEEVRVQEICAEALGLIGPGDGEAVSALTAVLSEVRRTHVAKHSRYARHPNVVEAAAKALGRMGPAAKEAVPELAYLFEYGIGDEQIVLESLIQMGPAAADAAPSLGLGLSSPRLTARWRAARALAALGPAARPAMADLVDALEEGQIAKDICRALANIGPDAIEPVRKRLASSNDNQRLWAACCLGALGVADDEVIGALVEFLHADDKDTRKFAAWGLAQMGPKAAPALSELSRAWNEGRLGSFDIIPAAKAIGPGAATLFADALARTSPSSCVGSSLAFALLDLGRDDLVAPSVRAAVAGGDPSDVDSIIISLIGMSPALRQEHGAELTEWLTHEDPTVRVHAAGAFLRDGPGNAVALAELTGAFSHKDAHVRDAAYGEAQEIAVLETTPNELCNRIVMALAERLTAEVETALPQAQAHDQAPWDNQDADYDLWLRHALIDIGPRAEAAVPALRRALRLSSGRWLIEEALVAIRGVKFPKPWDEPPAPVAATGREGRPVGASSETENGAVPLISFKLAEGAPDEIRRSLGCLRRGEALPPDRARPLHEWLGEALKKGETRRQDVLAAMGSRVWRTNPPEEIVRAYKCHLNRSTFIWLNFDADTDILIDWGASFDGD